MLRNKAATHTYTHQTNKLGKHGEAAYLIPRTLATQEMPIEMFALDFFLPPFSKMRLALSEMQ